jgi:hypothetical protein
MSVEYVATNTVTQLDRITLPFCKNSGSYGGEIYLEVRTTSSTTGQIIASSTLSANSGNIWNGCGSGGFLNATSSTWVLNENIQWVKDVHIFFNFRPVGISGNYLFTFNDYDDVNNYYTVFCSGGTCQNASFGTTFHIDSLTLKGEGLGIAPSSYSTSSSPVSCSTFDIGCYISTSFSFLLVPSSYTVDNLANITFSSSTPFNYLYDLSSYIDYLKNSSGTPLKIEMNVFGATTTILDTSTIDQFEGVDTAKNMLTWIIWILVLFVSYAEIYTFFFKKDT